MQAWDHVKVNNTNSAAHGRAGFVLRVGKKKLTGADGSTTEESVNEVMLDGDATATSFMDEELTLL